MQKENAEFKNVEDYIDESLGKLGNYPNEGKETKKPSEWTSDKVTAITDGKGGVIPLPDGYYYVGGNIETGIVISDKAGDRLDSTYPDTGNQFVWIPAPGEDGLKREMLGDAMEPYYELYTKLTEEEKENMTFEEYKNIMIQNINIERYQEPYASGYTGEKEEYNAMKGSVLKYGGFYFGRFETAVTEVDQQEMFVIRGGGHVPGILVWGTSMNDYGTDRDQELSAVALAKDKFVHPDSVVSSLCYGSQWDAMCRYIGDYDREADISRKITGSGFDELDFSKNIYDLAGNHLEWTMEAYGDDYRVIRGGDSLYGGSIGMRMHHHPWEQCYQDSGSRRDL